MQMHGGTGGACPFFSEFAHSCSCTPSSSVTKVRGTTTQVNLLLLFSLIPIVEKMENVIWKNYGKCWKITSMSREPESPPKEKMENVLRKITEIYGKFTENFRSGK